MIVTMATFVLLLLLLLRWQPDVALNRILPNLFAFVLFFGLCLEEILTCAWKQVLLKLCRGRKLHQKQGRISWGVFGMK
jgi:hypothetical protein